MSGVQQQPLYFTCVYKAWTAWTAWSGPERDRRTRFLSQTEPYRRAWTACTPRLGLIRVDSVCRAERAQPVSIPVEKQMGDVHVDWLS